MNPECRYVEQNSGQTQYSFTVNLDSCGTQFINDFEGEAGQAYLENVLVLQVSPFQPSSRRSPSIDRSFAFVWFRTSQVYRKFGTRCAEFVASGKGTSTKR